MIATRGLGTDINPLQTQRPDALHSQNRSSNLCPWRETWRDRSRHERLQVEQVEGRRLLSAFARVAWHRLRVWYR